MHIHTKPRSHDYEIWRDILIVEVSRQKCFSRDVIEFRQHENLLSDNNLNNRIVSCLFDFQKLEDFFLFYFCRLGSKRNEQELRK